MHGMQEVIGSTPIYSTERVAENGPFLIKNGVVAHLVEHLVRNQKVVGSSPIYSTEKENARRSLFCVADGPRWRVVGVADGFTTSPIYSTRARGHPASCPFFVSSCYPVASTGMPSPYHHPTISYRRRGWVGVR